MTIRRRKCSFCLYPACHAASRSPMLQLICMVTLKSSCYLLHFANEVTVFPRLLSWWSFIQKAPPGLVALRAHHLPPCLLHLIFTHSPSETFPCPSPPLLPTALRQVRRNDPQSRVVSWAERGCSGFCAISALTRGNMKTCFRKDLFCVTSPQENYKFWKMREKFHSFVSSSVL